jgi:hypothetical protein
MKYVRMAICETFTDDNVNELVTKMQDHVRKVPELIGHSILSEEGGRMVSLVTEWSNREDCLQYHASKSNRRFIADTQDMLIGSYVVKLFQNKSERQ